MMAGLAIMFFGNLGQQLRASGAFEIFIHKELVFSKLASHAVPPVEVGNSFSVVWVHRLQCHNHSAGHAHVPGVGCCLCVQLRLM